MNRTFTLISGITTILLLLSPVLQAQNENWVTYSSDEANATVQLPGEYQVSSEVSEDAYTEQIAANDGQNKYIFTYTLHDTPLMDHEGLSIVALQAFADAAGGQIVQDTDYYYNDHKGKEAVIFMKEDQATVNYRVIIIDQVQYQFIVISLQDAVSDKVKRFFGSFKLLHE